MKWINHRISAITLALISGGGAAGALLAYAGSTLPDLAEGKPPAEGILFGGWRKRRWLAHHRGASHWYGWYAASAIGTGIFFPPWHWLFLGALFHLLGDMLTPGGIPLLPWKNSARLTLSIFKTGSPLEYIVVWTGCALSLLLLIHGVEGS